VSDKHFKFQVSQCSVTVTVEILFRGGGKRLYHSAANLFCFFSRHTAYDIWRYYINCAAM